jgi:hypothetical protein
MTDVLVKKIIGQLWTYWRCRLMDWHCKIPSPSWEKLIYGRADEIDRFHPDGINSVGTT